MNCATRQDLTWLSPPRPSTAHFTRQNICERQLTKNGKPLGTKARGSGNAA